MRRMSALVGAVLFALSPVAVETVLADGDDPHEPGPVEQVRGAVEETLTPLPIPTPFWCGGVPPVTVCIPP